MTRGWIWYSKR